MSNLIKPKILILGGDGAALSSIFKFLPEDSIILGRKNIENNKKVKFIQFDANNPDYNKIFKEINSVTHIINFMSVVSSDIHKIGFNYKSMEVYYEFLKYYNARAIFISTLKANHKLFLSQSKNKFNTPYSPYAWSKFCAENFLKYNWKNSAIIRPGFINSHFSKHYYDKSVFVLDIEVNITETNDLWKAIDNELKTDKFSEVNVISRQENLVLFVRKLLNKSFIIPIPVFLYN